MFPIFEVHEDAPERPETLGTKEKFWFTHPELGACIFKRVRPNTGEDWAEKIAAEICHHARLPHARYELATWRGFRGVVSVSIVEGRSELVLGNEILSPTYLSHPASRSAARRNIQYTVDLVLDVIESNQAALPTMDLPTEVTTAAELFVGYLLIDAWIGNTDRHHENWGFIKTALPDGSVRNVLAPSFDHASSMGRELTDDERARRLEGRDPRHSVESYCSKARSAFFGGAPPRLVPPMEALRFGVRRYSEAARAWLGVLERIDPDEVAGVFARVPPQVMGSLASRFGQALLERNRATCVAAVRDIVG